MTDDELKAGAHGFNPESKVHAPGETAKAWYRSANTPGLWCKGDTSSDELDGHYFAWYLYHDLVADEAEKKEIAAVVRRVTDGIIRNHYTLVDHTGRKTRWGIWSPELINHDPFYRGLRPLNSLEILCYLKVAEHITGDRKYAEAADGLIKDHHYLLNGLLMRRGRGAEWPNINHSDDELLYLVYYPLLTLEKDPARRRLLVESIARTWEDDRGRAIDPAGAQSVLQFHLRCGDRPPVRRRGSEGDAPRIGRGTWSPGQPRTRIGMMSRSARRRGTVETNRSSIASFRRPSAPRRAGTPIPGTPTGEATAATKTTASPGSSRTGWGSITVICRRESDRRSGRGL